MSIKIKDLFLKTRMLAGDLGKAKYDDFEVVTAINTAVDLLVAACIRQDSAELIRRTELTLDEDAEADLPDGFRALVNLAESGSEFSTHGNFFEHEQPEFSYRIEGDKLVLPSDKAECVYLLVYHKAPDAVTLSDTQSDSAVLDLDYCFGTALAAMGNNLLAGELDAAQEKAENAVAGSRFNKRGAMFTPPLWCGRVTNR